MRSTLIYIRKLSPKGLALLGLLALWEVMSLLLHMPAFPGPASVASAFVEAKGVILDHSLASTWRALAGTLLALIFGVPAGFLLGQHPRLDKAMGTGLHLLYPLPKIAFLPVILLIFGLEDASKIFIIAVIVFFQVAITTRDAVRNLDPEAILSVVALGAGPLDIYRHAVFPAVLPEIFTAIRLGMGTALATLFFTETFATTRGLGYFIMDSWARAAYDEMFAGIAALGLLGLLLFEGQSALERWLCRWKYL